MKSKNGATLVLLEDKSVLVSGESPATDTYELAVDSSSDSWNALRIEVLPDASLPNQGPGRAGNGNFVLSEIRVNLLAADGSVLQPIGLSRATATYEQTGAADGNPYGKWAVEAAIDGEKHGAKWGWAVMERAGQMNSAVFELANDIRIPEGGSLQIILDQNLDNPQHTLGRFRVSFTSSPRPISAIVDASQDLQRALSREANDWNDDDRRAVSQYFRKQSKYFAPVFEELAKLQAERKQLEDSIPSTLVTRAVQPRTIKVLARGNWMDESGEEVKPSFPTVLTSHAPNKERLTREDLARWIVSPEHPLTSRVMVNRIWKLFFGYGISRRLDDFGSQGEPPSHPELLDWLARRFVEQQWNVKDLVKKIVMSQTYQRSSNVSATEWQSDPTNRWLARQNRYRLEAEFVRDNALAVSGLLRRQVGGSSVKPYQPPGYWAYLNFPQREWQNGSGESLYRRGLYTHWQRQYLHPALIAFDAPSREECTADRPRSNTPLQSLVLLNDPQFVEAARAFAVRALEQVGCQVTPEDPDDAMVRKRLQWMANEAISRELKEPEIEVLCLLIRERRTASPGKSEDTAKFLKVGEFPVPGNLDPELVATWTMVARAILNLHETITRP